MYLRLVLFVTFCGLEDLTEFRAAGAALRAPARVESAASCTTNVHVTCEPTRDERTDSQYHDQYQCVQKKIFQPLPISTPRR